MNKHFSKNKTQGFTLVELVIVLIVIGILSSIAIVRYTDLRSSVSAQAPVIAERQVQAAFGAYLAQNYNANSGVYTYPSVTALAALVNGTGVTAADTGVQMIVNGVTTTILTYKATTAVGVCTTPTTLAADSVQCVGKAI